MTYLHPTTTLPLIRLCYRGRVKTIRQLREEWGWSQLDLAVQIGASASAVYKWERGLAVPHPKYQRRLAALFGVRVEELALGPAAPCPQVGTRQERP